MKRALFVVPVALLLLALVALAGPRPRANLTATPTTVVTHAADEGAALVLQCPGGAVWYRTFTSAELTAQDGGLQADGGAFGVLADFRTQGDPIGIVMGTNQVAVGLAGISDAGSVACVICTP